MVATQGMFSFFCEDVGKESNSMKISLNDCLLKRIYFQDSSERTPERLNNCCHGQELPTLHHGKQCKRKRLKVKQPKKTIRHSRGKDSR